MAGFAERIDRYFGISKRGSTISTELKGGLITFLSMSYILAVNPLILSPSASGYSFDEIFTATALAAVISCLLMGLYARFPVALAPGMGLNAFLSYTICQSMGFTFEQGLMIVFLSGVIFFLVTVTGLRKNMLESIPSSLKIAISAGIGFFIALLNLYNTGLLVHGDGTALKIGDFSDPGVLLALFCIITTLNFWYHKKWYAIPLSMAITWIIGVALFYAGVTSDVGTIPRGDSISAITIPDLGLFGKVFTGFDMIPSGMMAAFVGALVSMFIVDMFDTTGTLLAVTRETNLSEGKSDAEFLHRPMIADASASLCGAVCGTSTTTSYIESFTGVESGARTGLMAIFVALLFAVALVFSGIFSTITSACTAGALCLVGLLMMKNIKDIEWADPVTSIASLITVFMMGLAGSITEGIALGFLAYTIGSAVVGRGREVSRTMWVLAVIFMLYFAINALLY